MSSGELCLGVAILEGEHGLGDIEAGDGLIQGAQHAQQAEAVAAI